MTNRNAGRDEIKQILAVYMVRGVFMTFMMFTTRVAIFSTLITYALSGDVLKASMVSAGNQILPPQSTQLDVK